MIVFVKTVKKLFSWIFTTNEETQTQWIEIREGKIKNSSGLPPVLSNKTKSVSAKPQIFNVKISININECLQVDKLLNNFLQLCAIKFLN